MRLLSTHTVETTFGIRLPRYPLHTLIRVFVFVFVFRVRVIVSNIKTCADYFHRQQQWRTWLELVGTGWSWLELAGAGWS